MSFENNNIRDGACLAMFTIAIVEYVCIYYELFGSFNTVQLGKWLRYALRVSLCVLVFFHSGIIGVVASGFSLMANTISVSVGDI